MESRDIRYGRIFQQGVCEYAFRLITAFSERIGYFRAHRLIKACRANKVILKLQGMKTILTAMAAILSVPLSLLSADLASDNASNPPYESGVWTSGLNGGVGFGPWSLATLSTGGGFIGGSALGPTTFAMWSTGGAFSASRPFSGALTSGQSFSLTLAHDGIGAGQDPNLSFISVRMREDSNVRISWTLRSSAQNWVLNSGSGDASIGQAAAPNTALTLLFTYNGDNSFSYSFGSATGEELTASVSLSNLNNLEVVTNFQGPSFGLGFNDLSIVPEPSTYALLGLGAAASICFRLRRKKA
jgi:hypothetical protein